MSLLRLAAQQTRSFSSTGMRAVAINKIGVIGMGLMGHGIVQTAAENGKQVVSFDMSQEKVNVGLKMIQDSLKKTAEKKVPQAPETYINRVLSNIKTTTVESDLNDCDLIVEAIVENIEVKRTLFKRLSEHTKKDAILASNTSSLSIGQIAEATNRPERVIGLHYFNPVQMMKLVEIVRTDKTQEDVFNATVQFVKEIGKTPVSCGDTPGFIVNRLLVPNIAQAILMLDKGIASRDDIDTAMKLGAGHPMGPLHLADYVGLDTLLFILDGWVKDFPNEPAFFVPESLRQKVKEGKLGRKSGEGYYKWQGNKVLA